MLTPTPTVFAPFSQAERLETMMKQQVQDAVLAPHRSAFQGQQSGLGVALRELSRSA
ncbi:hypothetical protein Pcac1_g9647 [Phytophthora cactorum]|nr:hypothetical protein Pcac1_g9647 [Phytophthora cactorum]